MRNMEIAVILTSNYDAILKAVRNKSRDMFK